MAKFYLNDFPKTPSAVPQAPIGATPAERKGGPPGYAQIDARVQNIDIAKNIPSLMQKELPENLSNALVGGKLRVGNAWANAAESLGDVAETAGKIAAHLRNSKNAADESRVSNLIKTSDMAFAEKAEQERWTLKQQLEIAPSWHQKLDEDIAGLGLSPENEDKAKTDLYLHHARQRTELTHDLRLEQEESDRTAITTDIESSVAAGDIERAMMLNERMLDEKLQSKGQRDSRKIEIENTYQEQKAAEIVALSPRASIPELEKLKRGGTSAQFPELKNKASIDRLLQDAYQTNHKQEVEAAREIEAGVKNRTIKNKDDISNISKGRLPQHVVDALATDLTSEIPLDYEKIADISRAIDAYPGAKVDKTYQQDHELRQRILTEVPKAAEGEKNGLREQLLDRLDKRHKTLEENSLKPAQAERDRIVSEAKDYTRDGLMFGDPRPPNMPWLNWGYTPGKGWGYTSERAPAPLDKLKTAEEKNKVWKRYDDAVHALDEFLTTKPDATVDEVRDKWNKIVYPDARNSAVERVKEKAKGMPGPTSSTQTGARKGFFATEEEEVANEGRGPNYPTSVNESLVESVKKFEGFEPVSKWDFKQYSVGYGTRGGKGERLTEAQAHERLVAELEESASDIDNAATQVGLALSENERNALISFDFNTGKGDELITSSAGDKAEILRRLQLYVKAGGKTNPGLVNRRRAEARMFQGAA